MSDPVDPIDRPPATRPAPDHLRERIAAELRDSEGRGLRPRHALAPLAAAILIVAVVIGATRFSGRTDAVPAGSPSAIPSGSASTGTAPSPTPDSPRFVTRELTETEISADLATCGVDGRLVVDALTMPTIVGGGRFGSARYLIAQGKDGTALCVDGKQQEWDGDVPEALPKGYDAASRGGSGSSASCSDDPGDPQHQVDGLWTWSVSDRVRQIRLTATSGASDRASTIVVDTRQGGGGTFGAIVALRGPGAWKDVAVELRFLGADGRTLGVESRATGQKGAATTDSFEVQGCQTLMAEQAQENGADAPKRPASDDAGVATCRTMITTWAETADPTDFDPEAATVAATVSTSKQWGTVLADGDRYVGCSLFPTAEFTGVRTAGAGTKKKDFGWALNPIDGGGETLWAAGRLPGVRSVTYELPGGRTEKAAVGREGHWLMMARTTTSFGSGDDVSGWPPVEVTAVTATGTVRWTIGWSEKTMCNQVSHGC
ncbi:hypothetical protein GCM10022204_38240 [Microlunatus aurantiacus]|uniref:Uncharacterized protein n=1 Tax=Microlunatus aurantiacus TaxID=446786 RepID=A0ABP7E952_9ACTN